MSQQLPVRKPGDKATGEPCIIPAGLNFCEICDCYTKRDIRFVRALGYPFPVCDKHTDKEAKLALAGE